MTNSGGNRADASTARNGQNGAAGESGLGRLDTLMKAVGGGKPPVHLWNPDYCGELDMRIRRDGVWFYEGTPIGRAPLVKLFASILKREGDAFFLVTPVEKVGIVVEDAPFLGVDIEAEGAGRDQRILIETQLGDRAIIGPDHQMRVVRDGDELIPYVDIRDGLEARIDRKDLFRLVDLAELSPEGDAVGVWSAGVFFELESTAALHEAGLSFDGSDAPGPAIGSDGEYDAK